jgi:hypothetical protein
MRAKCFRRWVSWGAIAAIVFGQFAIAVHACPVQSAAAAAPTTTAAAENGMRSCADMGGTPADIKSNACESHCGNDIVTPAQLDLPAVGFAALTAPAFTVVPARPSDGAADAATVAVSRAPPLTLRFCRLLI